MDFETLAPKAMTDDSQANVQQGRQDGDTRQGGGVAPESREGAEGAGEKAKVAFNLEAEILEHLREIVAGMQADKARLDWLEKARRPLVPCFGMSPPMGSGLPFPFDGWVLTSDDSNPRPLREAIDAAMRA